MQFVILKFHKIIIKSYFYMNILHILWKMFNFASKSNKRIMRYKIKKETNPTRPTCGKYKAVAVHYHTVESKQLIKEAAQRMGGHASNVLAVLSTVASVVNDHLREGDRVRLPDWGMMKLEIESEKVDNLKDFRAKKHIRGVRLHFLPESSEGHQELYEGITFEKDKTFKKE